MANKTEHRAYADDEVAEFEDPTQAYRPKSVDEAVEVINTYSDRLEFLWEQYLKVVQLNIILAGATIGLIANFTLLREKPIDLEWVRLLHVSLATAAFSGFGALLWRFCAQVQMDRQVYGNIKVANWYFDLNDSKKPQGVMDTVHRYEKWTETLKWISGGLLALSWCALFIFASKNLGVFIK
ncbi:MAG: hypothetical protein P1U88_15180 [Thalassobaculaceae bacterium]|nr:hypothetical protein [Thalassobaculaceae bacterium]